MIGFFDSGFGGLTVLKEVVKTLPDYSYVYLGDNARTPYGSLSQEVIYKYTCEGVEELFSRGAKLIILACNTSSSMALRRIQQEYLPKFHPDKNVLGIIIPTSEEMGKFKNIGIFATEATVSSDAYPIEISKFNPTAEIFQQACPLLVPIIESGEFDDLESVVKKYAEDLFIKNKDIEAVILGCTHYAIIEDIFRKYIPGDVKIVLQGKIVAEKLKDYLDRHGEIEDGLKKEKSRIFLTTEKSPHVQQLAELFYGEKIELEIVTL
ncbi:MAG: glutamate racemase [Candidatus Moranbacteria bacterium]|nr:glutamate racemase [Candidatus Moranbacteria bacterium]